MAEIAVSMVYSSAANGELTPSRYIGKMATEQFAASERAFGRVRSFRIARVRAPYLVGMLLVDVEVQGNSRRVETVIVTGRSVWLSSTKSGD